MTFRKPYMKPERVMPTPIPQQYRREARMVTPALLVTPKAEHKTGTFRSERWLKAVRSVECCVRCGAHGVDAAHRNEGKGMASKAHDCWTAALCRDCHREIDQGKDMSRDERRAEIDRAILLTLAELAMSGKVEIR